MESGAVCPSCVRYFRAPKTCPVCGRVSYHLSRDSRAGFHEPVCERCRRRAHITCPVCGKHRMAAGTNHTGQAVCRRCLEMGEARYVCPRCGREGKRHSRERCKACYEADRLAFLVERCLSRLPVGWPQDFFPCFIRDLAEAVSSGKVLTRLERYASFFAELGCRFPDRDEMTAPALMAMYGREGLRRNAIPYGYLLKSGLVRTTSELAVRQAAEGRRQQRILEEGRCRWYEALLAEFYRHQEVIRQRYLSRGWVGRLERFVPRTITANLAAAARFLASLDPEKVQSSGQIEQGALERFLLLNPGYHDGVHSFVRFLNRKKKVFRRLKVPGIARGPRKGTFLDVRFYRRLVRTWLNPADGLLKESLICLLMLLYAQKAHRIVRLKLSEIGQDCDGAYWFRFGKTDIQLDPEVGALLDRYLAGRKPLNPLEDAGSNPYLFPGRGFGRHLSEQEVTRYVRSYGITANQLFASSLFHAFLNGVKHPKVLVVALGITDSTAMKYFETLSPSLRLEASARMEK